jgi:predicted GIY-YIG superfamily endonuclease
MQHGANKALQWDASVMSTSNSKRGKKRISVYVLKLSGEKYYVGQSKHPAQRIKEHFAGEGSSWTRLHRPVEVARIIELPTNSWRAALEVETHLTLELMKIYGWSNVRGGPYSASDFACKPRLLPEASA